MKKIIATLACFVVPVLAMAYGGPHISMLRTEDGLSNNYIVSVEADSFGTIWIGTEEGMNSFDGVSVRSFTRHQGSVPANALNDVHPDMRGGKIWVATQRAGLGLFDYDANTLETFLPSDGDTLGISSAEITRLGQDREGNIWFSTYTKGLQKYDVLTGRFHSYNSSTVEGMEDYTIIDFALDNSGKVYLGHYSDGLTILDPERMTAVNLRNDPGDSASLPSNVVGCVHCDPDNNIWVGTRRGLALYRPVTGDFKVFNGGNSGLPERIIFSILVTSDRKILVSPDFNGVWAADLSSLAASPQFAPLPEASGIMNLPVKDMCEDAFGNLWIGSYGRGVLFVGSRLPGFSVLSAPEDLSSMNVTSAAALSDGRMAIGTQGGGLDLLDRDFAMIPARGGNFLTDKTVMSVFYDSGERRVWIGSFDGWTVVTDSLFSRKSEIMIKEARCFCEKNDTVWVGSGNGLYAVDRKSLRILERYSSQDILPENYLRSLCVDSYGRLWVGTFGSGLVIFGPSMEQVAHFSKEDGFPSNLVNSIYRDSRGAMYVATGEGLVCFGRDAGRPVYERVIAMGDGISSDVVKALEEDESGNIWFSTNLSVCRLDTVSGKVTEYRNGWGRHRPSGTFNGNSAGKAWDGTICFGSTEGLVRFDPRVLIEDTPAPSLHFRTLVVFGSGDPTGEQNRIVNLSGRDEVRLGRRDNNFLLAFSVDNYSLSQSVDYFCSVDGGEWRTVGGKTINFREMSPGRHAVCIKCRVYGGEYGPENEFHVQIAYPFFWNPVARSLYILAVALMAFLLAWRYKCKVDRDNEIRHERESFERQKEENNERLRFYTNITHELRTPLTLIIGPAEDLKNYPGLPEPVRGKILVLNKNVNRLLELVNRLLDFRKVETSNYRFEPAPGNLGDVVAGVAQIFAESMNRTELEFKTDIAPDVSGLFDYEIVTVILNNLLSNAVKYTASGTIGLGLHVVSEGGARFAELTVWDTGCGIPADQQPMIFDRYYQVRGRYHAQGTGIGLSLVKNLTLLHGGTIGVESEEGRGSRFRVRLPLGDRAPVSAPDGGSGPVSTDGKRPVIVVVEDNDDIRSYIAGLLSDTYTVYSASDGSAAWSMVVEHVPDLIISDIMMPAMDGLELCRRVKEDVRVSHIPVILLTAKETDEDRSEGYRAGGDSYITKPFTAGLLRARVKNLLESRRNLVRQFASSIGEGRAMEVAENGFGAIDSGFLRKITAVIEENIVSEDLDVSFLAASMNMSNSTLYRKLKAVTGMSANEYVRKIRMRRAAELLASGRCNVSETAWNVGFGNIIYFRQCFKNEFGMSPSEFRKQGGGGR